MSRKPMKEINGDALRLELKKRGLSLQRASLELGGSEKFLSDCVLRGRIAKTTMVMLDRLYNIAPDAYAKKNPSEARIPTGLEEAIQKAIHEAIIKYYEEERG